MRIFSWRSRKKEHAQDRAELEAAKQKVEELHRRTEKLKRDNHFVADVKRVLGAQQ